MKYYIVKKDLQGGEFGMDRCYSASGWGEQAYDWANGDDYEHPEEWLRENYKSDLGLINDIADWWEIRFAELDEEQRVTYEKYMGKFELLSELIWSAELRKDYDLKRNLEQKDFELHEKYWNFIDALKEV